MKKLVFISCLFTAFLSAQNADNKIEMGGYVKYLFSRSDMPAYGILNDHFLHSRFNTKYYGANTFTIACEVRTRIYHGGTVEHTPKFSDFIRSNYNAADLDVVLWNSYSSVGYMEIDRLWADWNQDQWQITLGRQRTAFGTNLVWNPTDVFNPFSILDFDYPERPGYDGIHVQYYLGPLSKLEIAIKPGKTSDNSAAVAAYTSNIWDYDLHILAARRSNLWLFGGSWAGDIAGAGFRGEFIFSQKPGQTFTGLFNYSETEGIMSSVALSADYTFANSLYLHFESLYNSAGVTQKAGTYILQSQSLGLLSPSRWSFFGEVACDITPLIRGTVFTIFNPYDRSIAAVPSVVCSVATNLDLTVLGLLFNGDDKAEFGAYGKSCYGRVQWSF